jgi:hypothetical protein
MRGKQMMGCLHRAALIDRKGARRPSLRSGMQELQPLSYFERLPHRGRPEALCEEPNG